MKVWIVEVTAPLSDYPWYPRTVEATNLDQWLEPWRIAIRMAKGDWQAFLRSVEGATFSLQGSPYQWGQDTSYTRRIYQEEVPDERLGNTESGYEIQEQEDR